MKALYKSIMSIKVVFQAITIKLQFFFFFFAYCNSNKSFVLLYNLYTETLKKTIYCNSYQDCCFTNLCGIKFSILQKFKTIEERKKK